MPEAVIVDAVRTPIGRAVEGSLQEVRTARTMTTLLNGLIVERLR